MSTGSEHIGGLGDSLGKFGGQVRDGMNIVCDMQRKIIGDLAKVGDILDEALKIVDCVASGDQQEEASSGLFSPSLTTVTSSVSLGGPRIGSVC